jgi:hypothetical protein
LHVEPVAITRHREGLCRQVPPDIQKLPDERVGQLPRFSLSWTEFERADRGVSGFDGDGGRARRGLNQARMNWSSCFQLILTGDAH